MNSISNTPPVPDPVERPKLAVWLWSRKLSTAWLAQQIGVSSEQVRRYCLEFGHDDRSVPGAVILEQISGVTRGDVAERDFYPPHIRGDDAPTAPAIAPAIAEANP